MNETLDSLFAKCQRLQDEELETLLNGILSEQKNRKDRDRKEAWARVREAITNYTAHYGSIEVTDIGSSEDTGITLHYGNFTFSEYGDIEVGA